MWFGGGVARPWRVAVISSADVTDAGAWAKLGDATAKFGVATLTATFTNFSFTQDRVGRRHGSASLSCAQRADRWRADDGVARSFSECSASGACERQSRFSDLEGSLHWEVGPLELSAQTGLSLRRLRTTSRPTRAAGRPPRRPSGSTTASRSSAAADASRRCRCAAFRRARYGMAGLELAYWPIVRRLPCRSRCRTRCS